MQALVYVLLFYVTLATSGLLLVVARKLGAIFATIRDVDAKILTAQSQLNASACDHIVFDQKNSHQDTYSRGLRKAILTAANLVRWKM